VSKGLKVSRKTRQPQLINEEWLGELIAGEKVQIGDEFRQSFFGNAVASVRLRRGNWRRQSDCASTSLRGLEKGKYGIWRVRFHPESGRAESGLLPGIELWFLWFFDSGTLN
jgi:hypothetical protein